MDTEPSFDGFNVKVSTDGGITYNVATLVSPPYDGTLDGQSAWYGHKDAQGWQQYIVDLSAYAGMTIQLQLGFRSDGSVVNPGVYIDDLAVAD